MNRYELLKMNESVVKAMHVNQIRPTEIKYIEVYERYLAMKKQNDKISYIITLLSDEYDLKERAIYGMIRRFEGDIAL